MENKSGWPVFKGNTETKTVKELGLSRITGSSFSCGSGSGFCKTAFEDGFDDNTSLNLPLLWNTQYTFKLKKNGDVKCSGDVGITNQDAGGANGDFLDNIAGDQAVLCNISSSLSSCGCGSAFGTDFSGFLPRPSTPLMLSVSPTKAWTMAGDPIQFDASPGSGGVGGTKKYAWFVCKNSDGSCGQGCLPSTFDFGGPSNVAGTETFSTSATYSRTFSNAEAGCYAGVALARDGDDQKGGGGHYALSNAFDFDVFWNTPLNSEVFGHNLPSTITEGTWIATNVTMRNTGSTTWSGSSYTLKKMAGPFIPSSVSMGSGSASTAEEYTFNFNMSTEPFEPLAGSWYDFDWSVAASGSSFGETLQWQTFVKEGSGSAFRLDAGPLWAWLSPDELHASTAVPGAQEEELQRVRVEDYPLPRERVQADGRYVLRYEASLGETEWDADFSFLVEYDPSVFEVGELERGRRGGTHLIQVAENTPGRLKVEGTRLPGRALSGEGLIFEIPLALRDGAEAPESLSLVEVVARR